jgi:hypothetical protein
VEMKDKLIWSIFWAMVAFFVLTIGVMVADGFISDISIGYFIFTLWCIFSALGIALLVLTVRQKIKGSLKFFLLLSGSSAAGFIVFVVLHNVISGLFDIEEAFFFILATIVCPLGFLVGAVGSIILGLKNEPKDDRANAGGKP